jgi:hypothetical protein
MFSGHKRDFRAPGSRKHTNMRNKITKALPPQNFVFRLERPPAQAHVKGTRRFGNRYTFCAGACFHLSFVEFLQPDQDFYERRNR